MLPTIKRYLSPAVNLLVYINVKSTPTSYLLFLFVHFLCLLKSPVGRGRWPFAPIQVLMEVS